MASAHSSAGILLVKMVADGVVAGAIGVIASVFACVWLCKCNEQKPRKRRRETIRPRRWCEERAASDKLVRRTLEIVEALGSPPLFIENPWTGRLKNRGLLNHLKLHEVDYCKYGMPYRKRTAIWTNTDWTPARHLCKHDCASSRGGKHLARAQQGGPEPSFTQRQLYRIPSELCDEIAGFCAISPPV